MALWGTGRGTPAGKACPKGVGSSRRLLKGKQREDGVGNLKGWAALMLKNIPYEELTERQKEAMQRIKGEPGNMIP